MQHAPPQVLLKPKSIRLRRRRIDGLLRILTIIDFVDRPGIADFIDSIFITIVGILLTVPPVKTVDSVAPELLGKI